MTDLDFYEQSTREMLGLDASVDAVAAARRDTDPRDVVGIPLTRAETDFLRSRSVYKPVLRHLVRAEIEPLPGFVAFYLEQHRGAYGVVQFVSGLDAAREAVDALDKGPFQIDVRHVAFSRQELGELRELVVDSIKENKSSDSWFNDLYVDIPSNAVVLELLEGAPEDLLTGLPFAGHPALVIEYATEWR